MSTSFSGCEFIILSFHYPYTVSFLLFWFRISEKSSFLWCTFIDSFGVDLVHFKSVLLQHYWSSMSMTMIYLFTFAAVLGIHSSTVKELIFRCRNCSVFSNVEIFTQQPGLFQFNSHLSYISEFHWLQLSCTVSYSGR